MRIVTAAEMRSLEDAAFARGVEAPALMREAGAGVADAVRRLAPHTAARVVVLLGGGNNGGDGAVAATALANDGFRVSVWSAAPRTDVFGPRHNIVELETTATLTSALAEADIVLDALVGTGGKPGLRPAIAEVTRLVNTMTPRGARVIALDIPTGVDATTGEASDDAILAHVTVTLGSPKRGCLVPPGSRYAGRIEVIDLGLGEPSEPGPRITTDGDLRARLPRRLADAHKSDFGTLLVIAGATTYTGAPGFVAEAAMRGGVGLATMAVPRAIVGIVAAAVREATLLPLSDDLTGSAKMLGEAMHRYTAAVVGPGMGRDPETRQFLGRLLGIGETKTRPTLGFSSSSAASTGTGAVLPDTLPLVIDADGLNYLSDIDEWWTRLTRPMILTPHPGEMARLTKLDLATVKNDPWGVAVEYARRWNQVVVLKGGPTVVAAPDGAFWAAPGGNPALATGGTGDVLAGLIGGFLAQGLTPVDAAVCGIHLGTRAGWLASDRVGVYGMVASDIFPAIPEAMRAIMGM